jgi:hypothetical protein
MMIKDMYKNTQLCERVTLCFYLLRSGFCDDETDDEVTQGCNFFILAQPVHHLYSDLNEKNNL